MDVREHAAIRTLSRSRTLAWARRAGPTTETTAAQPILAKQPSPPLTHLPAHRHHAPGAPAPTRPPTRRTAAAAAAARRPTRRPRLQ